MAIRVSMCIWYGSQQCRAALQPATLWLVPRVVPIVRMCSLRKGGGKLYKHRAATVARLQCKEAHTHVHQRGGGDRAGASTRPPAGFALRHAQPKELRPWPESTR
eukprot:13674067-Ditylum_brightwellii.AAC.1